MDVSHALLIKELLLRTRPWILPAPHHALPLFRADWRDVLAPFQPIYCEIVGNTKRPATNILDPSAAAELLVKPQKRFLDQLFRLFGSDVYANQIAINWNTQQAKAFDDLFFDFLGGR